MRSYTQLDFNPENVCLTVIFPWMPIDDQKEINEIMKEMTIVRAFRNNGDLVLLGKKKEACFYLVKITDDDITQHEAQLLLMGIDQETARIIMAHYGDTGED